MVYSISVIKRCIIMIQSHLYIKVMPSRTKGYN